MTRIKIPECSNPFEVTVNGRKYIYEAGIETDVPDDVAKAIEKHHKEHKKEPPEAKAPFMAFGEYDDVVTLHDRETNYDAYECWFPAFFKDADGKPLYDRPKLGETYYISIDNDPILHTVKLLEEEDFTCYYIHSVTNKKYRLLFGEYIKGVAIQPEDDDYGNILKVVIKRPTKVVKTVNEKYLPPKVTEVIFVPVYYNKTTEEIFTEITEKEANALDYTTNVAYARILSFSYQGSEKYITGTDIPYYYMGKFSNSVIEAPEELGNSSSYVFHNPLMNKTIYIRVNDKKVFLNFDLPTKYY